MKNLSKNEEKVLELYSFKRLNEFRKIADYKNVTIEEARSKYKNISNFISHELGIEEKEVSKIFNELKEQIKEIQDIFILFSKDRKEGFRNDFKSFYDWYTKQPRTCYYCGTEESIIKDLFINKIIEPKHPGWEKGSLQIEKLDPILGYVPSNMRLACVFCNNAKSDIIEHSYYKKYISSGMNKFILQFHYDKVKNK
jgi:hypothetical protein